MAVSGVQCTPAAAAADAGEAHAEVAGRVDKPSLSGRGDGLRGEESSLQLQVAKVKMGRPTGCADFTGGNSYQDAFDRDVRRGFAGQLCEKMGWRDGQGLGANADLGIVKG